MSTGRDKANQALGELIAITEQHLMRTIVFAAALRKARDAGHKQEVVELALSGDELAVQALLNLLSRFEGLMHEGNTIDKTLQVLRKEMWLDKLFNINFQQVSNANDKK